ncbi:hypothetical protein BH23CHL7_BH23CHL7_05130 [soil metagenome]
MSNEIPPEIVELRRRLAEVEAIAEARTGFNSAFRRAAGKEPPLPEPEAPSEPETPAEVTRGVRGGETRREDFNTALRRIRGFGQWESTMNDPATRLQRAQLNSILTGADAGYYDLPATLPGTEG